MKNYRIPCVEVGFLVLRLLRGLVQVNLLVSRGDERRALRNERRDEGRVRVFVEFRENRAREVDLLERVVQFAFSKDRIHRSDGALNLIGFLEKREKEKSEEKIKRGDRGRRSSALGQFA